MTKIVAISDLHGSLVAIPECDILLLVGDIGPDDRVNANWFFHIPFRMFLKDAPAKKIVMIAGNHDFYLETDSGYDLMKDLERDLSGKFIYLENDHVYLDEFDLKIFGSPNVPYLKNWAFYASDEELANIYQGIHEDTDILMTHGPAAGIGDDTSYTHAGSPELRNKITDLPGLKMHVFGHIHEGFGVHRLPLRDMVFYNVAYLDRDYKPTNGITEIEL